MAMDPTIGSMAGFTPENGNKIKCMARVKLLGRMAENIEANILTIKKMAMEFSFGIYKIIRSDGRKYEGYWL